MTSLATQRSEERPRSNSGSLSRDLSDSSGDAAVFHPGLVSIPGSQTCFDTPGRSELSPRLTLAAGQPGGRVERVGSATASFYPCLTNRLQPASDPVREGAQSDPGVGLLHSQRMEHPNDPVVASEHVNPRRQFRA